MDFPSYIAKEKALLASFSKESREEKYMHLIDLAKELSPLSSEEKKESNLVKGCQSRLYLSSSFSDQKIFFTAEADALISAGLAALLIELYSGENPLCVLSSRDNALEAFGLQTSISLHRANGFANILHRMKRDALSFIPQLEERVPQ